MTYPISEISGIGPEVADRLKSAGIRTTARLLDLAKGPKERKRLAEKTGIDAGTCEKVIKAFEEKAGDVLVAKFTGTNHAGLVASISGKTGISPENCEKVLTSLRE